MRFFKYDCFMSETLIVLPFPSCMAHSFQCIPWYHSKAACVYKSAAVILDSLGMFYAALDSIILVVATDILEPGGM